MNPVATDAFCRERWRLAGVLLVKLAGRDAGAPRLFVKGVCRALSHRSAGLQPAVSPICNRRRTETPAIFELATPRGLQIRDTADCKSALQVGTPGFVQLISTEAISSSRPRRSSPLGL